jgi:hypothetical protein
MWIDGQERQKHESSHRDQSGLATKTEGRSGMAFYSRPLRCLIGNMRIKMNDVKIS